MGIRMQCHKCNVVENAFPVFKVSRLVRMHTDSHHNGHNYVTYGPRSFAVSGPTVWNTLPSTLRVSTTTLGQFQSGVKTMLFRLAYET